MAPLAYLLHWDVGLLHVQSSCSLYIRFGFCLWSAFFHCVVKFLSFSISFLAVSVVHVEYFGWAYTMCIYYPLFPWSPASLYPLLRVFIAILLLYMLPLLFASLLDITWRICYKMILYIFGPIFFCSFSELRYLHETFILILLCVTSHTVHDWLLASVPSLKWFSLCLCQETMDVTW